MSKNGDLHILLKFNRLGCNQVILQLLRDYMGNYGLIIFLSPAVLGVLTYVFVILKNLLKARKKEYSDRRSFEFFVCDWMLQKGYKRCKVGKGSSDGGRDVIGYKGGKKRVVQAKFYKGSVGVKIVREIAGVALRMNGYPVIATTGKLTKTAKLEARQLDVVVWKF